MAFSGPSTSVKVPLFHQIQLGNGMELQVNVSGFSNGKNAKVEFQLKNSSRTWILHWGCTYRGNMNWFIPATNYPSGTKVYKQTALQTPFMKNGEIDRIIIELRDPKICAIEFVLKDGVYDKWLKLNQGNFRIEIPVLDAINSCPPIPKDLIERKAYLRWESKGRPVTSPHQQKVFVKVVGGDHHIVVAGNTKGATVLHWGVSKSSPAEWLAPPPDMLPEKSKLIDVACQTYFKDMLTGNGFFQFVQINLKQRRFLGIKFVIWSDGSWIKHSGTNFFVRLEPMNLSGQAEDDGRGYVKWLLDEISHKEKEAERSLMHRFNIATELTERCRIEGKLGLIGILVWMRLMACRQLKWNSNYNVKPRTSTRRR